MRTEHVPLRHVGDSPPTAVALPALCGKDEMAVDGVDTRASVSLLDRLLGDVGLAALGASQLTASDRDALLAALHRQCWGDRIVSTLTCASCEAPFDLSFELSAVQRSLRANAGAWLVSGRQITSAAGDRFTVPSAAEELQAAARGGQAGAAELASISGASAEGVAAASEALEAGAPIIDLELCAGCAACGHEQLARFDIQSFVLQRLLNERPLLLSEVHLLATSYGWSLDEILSLPRETRRSLAVMVSEARPRPVAAVPRGAW